MNKEIADIREAYWQQYHLPKWVIGPVVIQPFQFVRDYTLNRRMNKKSVLAAAGVAFALIFARKANKNPAWKERAGRVMTWLNDRNWL